MSGLSLTQGFLSLKLYLLLRIRLVCLFAFYKRIGLSPSRYTLQGPVGLLWTKPFCVHCFFGCLENQLSTIFPEFQWAYPSSC